MNANTQNPHPKTLWAIIIVIFLIFIGIEIYITHTYITSVNPGGNDFFSRWAGARALLIDGLDPYASEVTEDIRQYLDFEGEGLGGFLYPLHVIFTFWPLIYLPYPLAQAIWMIVQQWAAIGIFITLLAYQRWRLSPLKTALYILLMLSFYIVTRSIFLGQFTLLVTFLMCLSLWQFERDNDFTAGLLLALTSVKPQMMIFIGLWLTVWALSKKRWRFFFGLFATGGTLFLASLPLFPLWIISWMSEMRKYASQADGRNPIKLLLDTVWPNAQENLFYLFAVPLVLLMLYFWYSTIRKGTPGVRYTLYWTIIVQTLITFQTGTTNMVLLLVPITGLLKHLNERYSFTAALGSFAIFSFGLWWLFLATIIDGNKEHPIMFLPLPFLALILMILAQVKQKNIHA